MDKFQAKIMHFSCQKICKYQIFNYAKPESLTRYLGAHISSDTNTFV